MPTGGHKNWFEEPQPSLNLTPLLDVVFNLIFFFILATTIKESQAFLNVSLPYSEQAQITEQKLPSILIIDVTEKNEVFLRDKVVEINTLSQELSKITQTETITNIVIRGDAKAYHQTIIRVLDACAEASLRNVSVEVQPESSP